MKKSEITNELKAFLKKENCYDEYMRCFDEGFNAGEEEMDEGYLIALAFNWDESFLDYSYWKAVSGKWEVLQQTKHKPTIEEGKPSYWDETRIDAIGQNGNTGEHYTKPHPLLNPDSPHYKILGDDSIEQFEKMFTVDELKAWAKLSYYKYMFRLGRKDSVESEIKKMKTYEDYYNYLNNQ